MNEKGKVLGVLGLVTSLEGYVLNEIFMMIALTGTYNPPGTVTHSNPIIIGTAWLLLVPFGFMLVLVSIVIEIKNRIHKTDTNEIWN
jgi:hypothetical protein